MEKQLYLCYNVIRGKRRCAEWLRLKNKTERTNTMKTTEKRRHIFGTIAFILAFAMLAIPLMHMPVGAAIIVGSKKRKETF